MFTNKLSVEERISKAVVAIMGNPKYVALAGVLMIGDRRVEDDCPTAYTNGRDEVYGRGFVETLNDAELRFLILHETYHKLYKHLTTWRSLFDKSQECANAATDYVINLKLVDDNIDGFAKMPECGLLDKQFKGMNTREVFEIIYKANGGQSNGSQPGTGTTNGTVPNSLDEHDWDGAQELSAEEKRELERDLDEAIRQGAMTAGKLGTGGDRELAELLKPQIDWRQALRDFINATCAGSDYSTWARPNRRYRSLNVYLPSGISEKADELLLAIDTSGSIGNRELGSFLAEAKAIAETVRPNKVRILYWDTKIAREEVYEIHQLNDMVTQTKPAGGGGTNVTCVPEYMHKNNINPQAAIILTDGYFCDGWGEWHCPVLWCLIHNDHTVAPIGKTLHVDVSAM